MHRGVNVVAEYCNRFEPPDATGHRTPGLAFNSYILEELVPGAYLDLLQHLAGMLQAQHSQRLWALWPRYSDDKATQTVTNAFYALLPTSTHQILPTASGKYTSGCNGVFCPDSSDSASIDGFLYRLQPENLFCPPTNLQKNEAFGGVTSISAAYAHFVLRRQEHRLEQQLTAQRPALHPVMQKLLAYLLDNDTSLNVLKLLPLQSGDLAIFGEPRRYYSLASGIIPPTCFSSSHFVDTRLSSTIRNRIVAARLNVETFDVEGVRELLGRDLRIVPQDTLTATPALRDQLNSFWDDFAAKRIPATFEALADLPLLSTDTPLRYVSFRFCRTGGALLAPSVPRPDMRELLRDLTGMGMQFLNPSWRGMIPEEERKSFEFSLLNVVGALRRLDILPEAFLRVRNPAYFAEWARLQLNSSDRIVGIEQLPIWEAHSQANQETLVALDNIHMLPATWSSVPIRAITAFLAAGIFCAPQNALLARFIHKSRQWSPAQAFRSIVLPRTIAASQLRHLADILRVLTNDISSGPIIPDEEGILRHPGAVYDHRVSLFVAAFSTTSASRFVHPDLRRMISHLVTLGVNSTVGFETFLEAAKAIDIDFENDLLDYERAEQIFECFLDELPASLRRQDFSRWHQLRDLHFVPRTTGQVQGLTFASDPYIVEMDTVVAPSNVVRQEFEPIAWTQCARLPVRFQPSSEVLIAFREFGQPSTLAVVRGVHADFKVVL